MGVIADVVRQQTDHAQRVDNLLLPRLGVEVGIQPQWKIEDLRDALARVQ